jgi:mannose-6-phosphate isomerase
MDNRKAQTTLYPLRFRPILVERVWGGQTLARYGKSVPTGKRIGESWEISDRDDAQSIVINGPLAGQSLRQLIAKFGYEAIVGRVTSRGAVSDDAPDNRFPLLIKLLDARERLSLQVHPPATVAGTLGGEPKTEMWYTMDADPGAFLIAGLKRDVTRQQFESALTSSPSSLIPHPSSLPSLVHQFPVKTGDAIFVPSGRLHAIGDGLVIAEIQQNSDTTYRVYDWGRPRPLHIAESLASINFNDREPSLDRFPITCDHFHVEKLEIASRVTGNCDGNSFQILGCVAGEVVVSEETLRPGEFALLPAALGEYLLTGLGTILRTML